MTNDLPKLESGETIRVYVTAERWFDIRHEGWTLHVSGSMGVVAQPAGEGLRLRSLLPPAADEL